MKKKLLLFSMTIIACASYAQMMLPNGNFEDWTSVTFDYPQGFTQNSNPQAYFRYHLPFNVTKSTDAYSGSFALQMETQIVMTDTNFAFISNPQDPNASDPTTWTGGFPITEKPIGIRGYYKYNTAIGDSAGILIIPRAGGSPIGMYLVPLGGLHTSYTLFNYTFNPPLPVVPDSILMAYVSSNPMAAVPFIVDGSTVLFDSISFTGITTQPVGLNGDFELWSSQTLESPDSWYMGSDRGQGINKTTDKAAGNFAAELLTTLGDNNGVPRANPGQLSTGYWDESCHCQLGGEPFTNMVDTLSFYYKYVPADPADTAFVSMNFKNGGAMTSMVGAFLLPSPTYVLKEVPVNLFSTVDSVIITIQSSNWQDSTLNFIGASLKVDEMHFKSQPLMTGVNSMFAGKEVTFYPNPFRNTGTITVDASVNTVGMEVIIYDAVGAEVKRVQTNEHKVMIDRNDLKNGIYFYELRTADGASKKGKIVIE